MPIWALFSVFAPSPSAFINPALFLYIFLTDDGLVIYFSCFVRRVPARHACVLDSAEDLLNHFFHLKKIYFSWRSHCVSKLC